MPAPDRAAAERPIAVFDSGVGGLTVLHELLVSLPGEDFVYLGDTARFPYGDKTPEQLRTYALEIAEHLLATGAKLLVVACGSATATALPLLERHLAGSGVDVLGVVAPAAELAVEASASGRIGLLATPATVASGAFAAAIGAHDGGAHLESVACPDLAPIIQSGFPFDERVVETVRRYTLPLRTAEVDTVILGSTHYPLVAPMLQRMLGRGVRLVTCGAGVVRNVERALDARGLLSAREGEGAYRFLCTGDVETFRALGTRFLQMPLGEVERIVLRSLEAAA
ncbi:MAG TPA: glutamate racemase [Conexibacter sp.]|nr:glutamate racemase [Conexibacter sp.]